jgi:hypothetical protein
VTAGALAKLPKLQAVWFRSLDGSLANPMCSSSEYTDTVRQACTALLVLDGQRVTGEAAKFYQDCARIEGLIAARPAAAKGGAAAEQARISEWLVRPDELEQLTAAEGSVADGFNLQLAACAEFIKTEREAEGDGGQEAFLTAAAE